MNKSVRFIIAFFIVFGIHANIVPAADAIIRVMPLGDSITRGYTGSSDHTGYRRELDLILTGEGYSFDFVGSLNEPWGAPYDFDKDHEGHSGWTSSQILSMVYDYLTLTPADIVLLHIGTNDISGAEQSAANVAAILDAIDDYETIHTTPIWVILARIINRNCITEDPPCLESEITTDFNDDVEAMAQDRIDSGDKILLIDMEDEAGFDYRLAPAGDMNDNLHPSDTGYEKMADLWFSAIQQVTLPVADAGPDQSVQEGDSVTLNGTGSSDPNSSPLNYQWTQLAGTSVVLSEPQGTQPFFTAPEVDTSAEILTFMLTVTNEEILTSSDTVDIAVGDIQHMIAVTSPGGGEELSAGASFEITWTSEGPIENVLLEYSVNNGENWIEIVPRTVNDGSYDWEVPYNPSEECLIRISDVDGGPADESDAVFSITPPMCKADFNNDNIVDGTDVEIFSIAMGKKDCTLSPPLCNSDIEGDDNDIDGADLAVLASEYGRNNCP